MLRVRRDKHAAEGATHLDKLPIAEREAMPAPVDLHFSEVAAILRRRSSLILMIAGIGTALATVVGLLIPPRYTATTQLVVEAPVNSTERASGVSAIFETIDTHVTLLSSRDHLQRVIDNLLRDPQFGPDTRAAAADREPVPGTNGDAARSVAQDPPAGSVSTEATGLAELGRRLSVWLAELRRSGNTTVPQLDAFERNTKVMQERRSRVISVGFTSTSPQKAAAFANRIVQLYVDGQREQKQASATREMAHLDQLIAEARYETETAGAAVQKAIQQGRTPEQNVSGGERAAEGQLRELLRHAGSSAQRHDSLLRSRKELREQQATSAGEGIQVLLAGVPDRPSSHNPILFVFPAFIVFAIGGCWLAVVLERLDRGLRDQRETAAALGVPCVGLVPLLPTAHANRPDRYLLTEPFSEYADAIRSAVATWGLTAARSSNVILISSSIRGEGKTTLARSLAAHLGFLGKRVLLINLDLRPGWRPGEHDDAGRIVDLFAQDCTPVELIRHIAGAPFDSLPMAGYRFDPLALTASDQMPRLIRQLRERYDCVIIDGPPVLGAIEARSLPSIADKLLLVVKWGSTRREVSQNALNLLRQSGSLNGAGGDVAAAIVTQVDLKKHARYRYGDAGEFLATHSEALVTQNATVPSPMNTGQKETETSGARKSPHERLLALRSKLGSLKAGQLPEPKAAGEGTDGRAV
jgi:succinoglycan biosynthesis transport protein ExoP